MALLFKPAETEAELLQIHALNHRVFAEEIAQHAVDPSGLLIDRFDSRNRYFIAVRDGRVAGMISAHLGPDFSVTRRLPHPDALRSFERPLEIRLLAIEAPERQRTILSGLLWQVCAFAREHDASHLLISAIAEREGMYAKLGFEPLGPAVPEGAASFIPMVLDMQSVTPERKLRAGLYQRRWRRALRSQAPVSLMPGPVALPACVAEAYAAPPVSHRSAAFADSFEATRHHLHAVLLGSNVALFPGGGTLANDVVAANLRAIFRDAPGIVLSNGEFGERLAHQAMRAGLRFSHLRSAWGRPWPLVELQHSLADKPAWLWAVHVETSTGALNDAAALLAAVRGVDCAVALDCVSSVGATPLPHAPNLLFTSGVSGKSLGSYAGVAFVGLNAEAQERLAGTSLCPTFDLLSMLKANGPVSTVPSSTLLALAAALRRNYATPEATLQRFHHHCEMGRGVRAQLAALGLYPIADHAIAAPNITSFALPSPHFPEQCLEAGYQIASESSYLQTRGWGQIATMGDLTIDRLAPFFDALR